MTLDKVSESAQQWLSDVLAQLGLDTAVSIGTPDDCVSRCKGFGGIWLTIESDRLSPDEIDYLLADHGKHLDALQNLLNLTMNQGLSDDEDRRMYTIELNDFRNQRYLELADLAQDVAEQVRSSQQEYEMPPLSAAERRLVHTLLVDDVDLSTFSRGQDRDRRLIVCPAQV